MSVDRNGPSLNAAAGAAQILARAGTADVREDLRLDAAIDDLFLDEHARLDDQARAAVAALIEAIVGTLEREMTTHVARAGIDGEAASSGVLTRLIQSGLLRDRALMTELVGRARQDLLATGLAAAAPQEGPGFLSRLVDCPDGIVAAAASDFLVAESRRRGTAGGRTELPAELHRRLVWCVAAALHERLGERPGSDRALAEAAMRSLNAHDEGDRLEAAAQRLCAAIDARPGELGALLVDALLDARPTVFLAAIANATGLDYAEARAAALDPDGDRLWLILRAQGLDRATIARIGLALAEADRRRDVEAFADSLDAIVAIEADAAALAIAPLRLAPEFRAALRALARSGGRR